MRKDRTEAAFHVGLRQAPSAIRDLILGMAAGFAAIHFLAPPYWLMRDYHFIESYFTIAVLIMVIGTLIRLPKSRFRQPSEERLKAIMENKILHCTRLDRIASMQADAAAQGKPGMFHLRPTSDFHSFWKVWGYGTYCFSGWPSKRDLFLAAGRPDAVIVIDPAHVPKGGILVRQSDAAILLDRGYTGPATVLLMSDVGDEVFAPA